MRGAAGAIALAVAVVGCAGGELDVGTPAAGQGGAGGAAGAAGSAGSTDVPAGGTHIAMDFSLAGGFYGAPFPSDARVRADGTVNVDGFPDPTNSALVQRVMALLVGERGFGTTSAIFFSLDGPLADGVLPSVHASASVQAPVFLVSVDPSAPDFGRFYPVSAHFAADGGPFGVPNLLTLLPVQGVPLRPKTTYAAVVTTDLVDAAGEPLSAPKAMRLMLQGTRPDGMSEAAYGVHKKALDVVGGLGVSLSRVAGLTVFTTGDPTHPLQSVLADALARPLPQPLSDFTPDEVFDDYCVFHTTVRMPVYQSGEPPYADVGGAWTFDASGKPILDHEEEARLVVTIPRQPMPPGGYPTAIMSRTGGGGDRPLVDRGPQAMKGGPPLVAGTGPALHFARAGFAGVTVDGPLGGPLRNPKNADEQFLIFNVANPAALRDNVRQSAVELALIAHALEPLALDVSACPGATGPARFDPGMTVLMGHSMGATISPLAVAFEPRFRGLLLSGSGGSWIENVIDKLEPLAVRGIAEVLLGLTKLGYHLHEHDPLLSMFQWAGEGADSAVYGRYIVHEPPGGAPRSVLMMQGIVDHYIMPSIANVTTLSMGLDLAGGSLDSMTPEIASFTPVASILDLVGRSSIDLPASGNIGGPTAVVVQHREDGIEDGHEVVFQTEAPKKQYRCFLTTLKVGVPRVPLRGPADEPCSQ